ncbi:MAG: 3D domain-containing protein [Centipeda sp. (in: firmicutes)]
MKMRKLLWAARNLMRRAGRHREMRRMRGALSVGTALAVTAPLALHAPVEAAYLRVEEGARGAAVQHVQELLIKAGYLNGAADGIAGPLTRAAIERCQADHALVVDGICGAATYRVLSGGAEYDPVALGIVEEHAPQVSRGGGRSVYVSATAYSAYDPGNGNRTATGTPVRHGVIAVDPSVIPLGTRVFIPGYGEAVAEDIGGAIHGYRIDVAFDTHAEALMFGRQDLEIFIME